MASGGPSGGSREQERILPASRRPDGTLRKEIRIRAGYVPQDEVAIYEAKGSRPRNSGPVLPPGVDQEMAEKMNAKSRAAKKNEKRKEKKASGTAQGSVKEREGAPGERPAAAAADTQGVAGVEQRMASLQLAAASGEGGEPGKGEERSGEAEGESGSVKAEVEKKIRALKKKVRQAEALQLATAHRLKTSEEEEKISRLEDWKKELLQLEGVS